MKAVFSFSLHSKGLPAQIAFKEDPSSSEKSTPCQTATQLSPRLTRNLTPPAGAFLLPGVREIPGQARNEGLGSALRQAQGPPLPPSALRIGHKYGRARVRTLDQAHLVLTNSLS